MKKFNILSAFSVYKLLAVFVALVLVTTAITFAPNISYIVSQDGEAVVEAQVTAPEELPAVEVLKVTALEESNSISEVVSESPEIQVEEVASVPMNFVPPTLSTDKDDYHPGETATIFGKLFSPVSNFVLKVFGSDENDQNYTESTATVTTDENGDFSNDYTLDDLYRPFYEMTVSTPDGAQLASSWFRDSSVKIYDQCTNDDGDGYAAGDLGCRWTNGAINASNSTYHEGDSTVQRLFIEGFEPGTNHTVTLKYGTTKGGKHAYDFLTTWNASENWVLEADRCDGVTGCVGAGEDAIAIPVDPNAQGHDTGTRNFVMRGGDMTLVSTPTMVSGSYAGDSETVVTVTFTVANSGNMCTTKGQVTSCGVALFFGAHISKSSDWTPDLTAVSISGSPYHVALASVDNVDQTQGGGRDNQMAASAIPATIIIHKNTVPDSAQDFNFTTTGTGLNNFTLDDDADGTLSNTQTFLNLNSGNFTVTEAASSGYTTTVVCTDPSSNTTTSDVNRTASINLGAGETVECTFTNTLQQGTLTLQKTVIKDNGGVAVDTAWTLSASGATPISGVEGDASITNAAVNSGSYNLSESIGPVGYTASDWVCVGGTQNDGDTVTVAAGQNVTCTITNNDNAPSLTLVKEVINDNGGTAVAGNWTLVATGYDPASPDAGTYNLSETGGPTGYTQTSLTCSDTGSAQVTSVTLSLGENVTCTFVNNDVAPRLTVIKHVINDNGGTAVAGNFSLIVNAVNTNPGGQFPGSEAGTLVTLNAGVYGVGESVVSGYAQSFSADCAGSIAVGQEKTCTVTNDDIAPTLTLVKNVTNDNGGAATAANFQGKIDGNNVSWNIAQLISAGAHTASETNIAGYTAGSWGGDCAANGSVSLSIGENKTCTITNDDQPGTLIVRKVVDNGNTGATTGPTSFSFAINGGSSVAFEVDGQNDNTVNAGTYNVTEPAVSGYTTTYDNCSDVVVTNGGTATCTITNTAIAPKLTLVKTVNNTHGGNATTSDFQGKIDGGNVAWSSAQAVTVGAHTATETSLAGYTAGSWGGDCAADGTVSLALGQEKTCTITNSDQAAHIILNKVVINDNGGTAGINDFGLTVGGNGVSSGSNTEVNSNVPVALNEAGLTGYSFVNITGDAKCPAVLGGTVTLNEGETVTCTITNNDIAPTLTLVKQVVNDNGGTAVPANWTLTAAGYDSASPDAGTYNLSESNGPTGYNQTSLTCSDTGAEVQVTSVTLSLGENVTCTFVNDDQPGTLIVRKVLMQNNGGTETADSFSFKVNGGSNVSFESDAENSMTVNAGTYSVVENAAAGYTTTYTNCSEVVVTNGGTATCTIVNHDTPPSLTLVKQVINNNGGTALNTAWTLGAAGYDALLPQIGTYNLSETGGPTGYNQTSLTCSDTGAEVQVTSVTLGLGENVTCTFVNDDQPAHLIVIKHVINDSGDNATASDFTMTLTGNNLSTSTFVGSEAGVNVTLNAGAYTADEVSNAGYVKTLSAECSGTLAPGETKTCTITNNDIPHPTRTQGFWQTHTAYTASVLAGKSWTIGTHTVDTPEELFSGFYASLSKTSTGAKRSALDQARMQMLQQWLAAKLNCAAFTCSASTQTMLSNAASAFGGTDKNLILSYASQLDAYNNSNDALPISAQGKATPKNSQALAGTTLFWNILQ